MTWYDIVLLNLIQNYGVIVMTTPKTVLSLSGGGVKGIAQLVVLAEIERITGKYIVELFDVIVG